MGGLAERVGFEPTVEVAPYNGFRDRRLRPLSHLSARRHHALEPFLGVGAKGHLVPNVCRVPAHSCYGPSGHVDNLEPKPLCD